MTSRTPLLASALVLLLAAAGAAQTAFVLNRGVSSNVQPAYAAWLPNAAYHGGNAYVPPFLRPELPNYYAGSIVATGTPLPPVAHEGGLAIDQDARIVYATDGTSFLSQDSHDIYGSPPTAPTVPLPLAGAPAGSITGLAVSSAAGLLYICGSTTFQARSKTYPYAAAGPVIPIPPFIGIPGATGIEYDPATGTLWACNVMGATVQFTTTGALLAAFPPPPVPGLGPIRGIAINSTAGPLAAPPPPGQLPGFRVCLTDGAKIIDAMAPFGTLALAAGFESYCRGLAISADPILLPGRYVASAHRYNNDPTYSPYPFYYPTIGITRPTCANLSSISWLTLDCSSPFTPVLLIADLLPLGASGGGLLVGENVLWLSPFTPTFLGLPLMTNGAAHVEIGIPLSLLPPGFQLTTQWLVADPAAYLGYEMSDALLFNVALR